MSLSNHARDNSPWEYPDCPNSGGHLFVERCKHAEYQCHRCEIQFNGGQ